MTSKLASEADVWYNKRRNIVALGGAGHTPSRINLSWRSIVNTVSPRAPQGKPHYVYTLAYPESMGGHVFYVGKGTGKRIHDHEIEAQRGKTSNLYKTGVINKIWNAGGQVVKRKLAFFATHEEACMYEVALIFFMDGLTNLTDGGDGSRGLILSEEACQKISERLKGHSVSEGTRQRISQGLLGHTHSQVTRQKISQKQIGKKGKSPSLEVRQRISETLQGHPVSSETRQKMSNGLKGKPAYNKGQHLPEEQRQKISAGNKGKQIPEEVRQKISKTTTGRKKAPFSIEHRQRLSEAHKGQVPWNKGKTHD